MVVLLSDVLTKRQSLISKMTQQQNLAKTKKTKKLGENYNVVIPEKKCRDYVLLEFQIMCRMMN